MDLSEDAVVNDQPYLQYDRRAMGIQDLQALEADQAYVKMVIEVNDAVAADL